MSMHDLKEFILTNVTALLLLLVSGKEWRYSIGEVLRFLCRGSSINIMLAFVLATV